MMPTPRRSECERGASFTFSIFVFIFFPENEFGDNYTLWASGLSPGGVFISKSFVLLTEFDAFS